MLAKFNYTGAHELGAKSTNHRKCQEDQELDRFRSNRIASTYNASLAQLVRAPACHAGGQGFKSPTRRQIYLGSVMAAYQSPKLLVGVRVPAGMPKFNCCDCHDVWKRKGN